MFPFRILFSDNADLIEHIKEGSKGTETFVCFQKLFFKIRFIKHTISSAIFLILNKPSFIALIYHLDELHVDLFIFLLFYIYYIYF